MKHAFKEHRFTPEKLALLVAVAAVLDDFQERGFTLTLRQLYYQLVARALIPNSQRSYNRLGVLVGNGRLAGLIDWGMIEDRGRRPASNAHWGSPGEIIDVAARGYAIDKWETQPEYVEVWVEKDALSGVLRPVCSELDVTFMANKGYSSLSAMYEAGYRMLRQARQDKSVTVLYLGDHDPSGLDMTRDIDERLYMFRACAHVKRIALTMEQIEEFNPPPNPAKHTDARYRAYVAKYGPECWELDALDPSVLQELVRSEVLALRDEELWDKAVKRQEKERKKLLKIAKELKR